MRVLDIADDNGALLLAQTGGLQGLDRHVKEAAWREPGVMRTRDYALLLVDTDGREHGKYACYDPGNTLVSMLYLQNAYPRDLNPAAAKTAAATLASLAVDWGLPVPEGISKLASMELSEADSKDIISTRRVRYNPPKLADAPKAAPGPFEKAASARQRWADLDPFERRDVARELIKEAESAPLYIPTHFYQYAGDRLSPKFAAYMRERQDYTSDPDVVEGYKTLAKIAAACEPDSVVQSLYVLDELAHLRWAGGDRYGETLADPVRCVYHTDKVAAYSWNHGAEATNENELFVFTTHPTAASRFLGAFTPEVWQRFRASPVSTFQAMPLEQKVLVSRMAREV